MSHKVLIFEDDAVSAFALEVMLSDQQLSVTGIHESADNALDVYKRENPDIILMDIRLLGEVNGIDAAKKIREISEVPIVFMSAFNNMYHKNLKDEMKNIAFAHKPYSEDEIIKAIQSLVA